MIDSFHFEAYQKMSVNYNRDVEVFPVVKRILTKIIGDEIYRSPTDMGVNCAGFGIVDDAIVQEAAKQEIIRRFFRYKCEFILGLVDREAVERAELLMKEMNINVIDRKVVSAARQAAEDAEKKGKGNKGVFCGAAIELKDGRIIIGKNSPLMHAASSLVLNVLKELADIPDKIPLLSKNAIDSISNLKKDILKMKTLSLDLDETLISLSISATSNPVSQLALEKLTELQGCEVHMTHIPTPGDEAGLRRLGVNLTTDPNFSSGSLCDFR
jgi:uncharacterized protein (UPF0371 family)